MIVCSNSISEEKTTQEGEVMDKTLKCPFIWHRIPTGRGDALKMRKV